MLSRNRFGSSKMLAGGLALLVAACSGSSETTSTGATAISTPAGQGDVPSLVASPAALTIPAGSSAELSVTIPPPLSTQQVQVYIVNVNPTQPSYDQTDVSTSPDPITGGVIHHLLLTVPLGVGLSEEGTYSIYAITGPVPFLPDGGTVVTSSNVVSLTIAAGCGDEATSCAGKSCGLATNNCGQRFDCGECGDGAICKGHVCVAQCVGSCK